MFPLPELTFFNLNSNSCHGDFNMALDELLLKECSSPWLRLYKWREETVSIGYFMPQHSVDFEGRPWVRRWTGGGMVVHGTPHEATFSLGLPANLGNDNFRFSNSYLLIHQQVQKTLIEMGISCYMEKEAPEQHSEGCCFKNPVESDIINASNGEKIVGGAQRRNRHGLLHQGSIQGPLLTQQFGSNLARAFGKNVRSLRVKKSHEEAARKLACSKYRTVSWKKIR